ncbi:MAG: zf-TFIIB domain-containing protein [Mycobacteriales bacterium]
MQLTCPKCQSDMRQYERNSVIVDQCTSCRGIFLDQGELEKLSSAAQSYYSPEQSPSPDRGGYGPPRNAPVSPVSGAPYGYGRGHHESHGYGHGQYKKKKKRSFFEDLLGD